MALRDELLELETKFWTMGPQFYREHVDDRCMVAFSPTMVGALSRKEVAETVRGPRFDDPKINVKGLLEPTSDFALLTYEAETRRSNGGRYAALVSSGYVRRDGQWKLAFHQHTQL